MELTEAQKKRLRTRAHDLKPVVMVGQHGMKPTILEEIISALDYHQLIKVKLSVGDRDLRDEIIAQIVADSQCELVQRIGNIAILYRRNTDRPDILKQDF
ncbi:MAG TPA: YhbY family RNA-binding protein [Candidatus Thiothrix moscowensis]|uniref:YhbY family RNA-binding protein n=1 Tax=unclassified Thiothrix TaxID=2636184 RepID=UPI0025F369F7|nr:MULTISPECIES: YhbY family RNA-binding protein [unclassified Thiothrix]HRJ53344.1 YhbY family RNA-binding protein [Candidatus Thiothrix moscowensis]HRJ94183.1 YhbY family RNA-binding protein [Candidatus Thiothrix moscowensis]